MTFTRKLAPWALLLSAQAHQACKQLQAAEAKVHHTDGSIGSNKLGPTDSEHVFCTWRVLRLGQYTTGTYCCRPYCYGHRDLRVVTGTLALPRASRVSD